MRSKWRTFGTMVNIPSDTLDSLKCEDCVESFTKVYNIWSKKGDPPITWKTIVGVLESDVLGENTLANNIREKFGVDTT